jgi:nucleoside transporter
MTDASFPLGVRLRLCAMMFLQYMLLPVWFMPLAAYLDKLQVVGNYRAAIVSSMALGCLASPLIGMVADRHFASEKVLAVLNLLAAVLLVLSALVTSPLLVFLLLLAVMLCYMPTWGLTSSIAMSHSPAEKFPQIRVFGSIGWVASGVFSLVAMWLFTETKNGKLVPLTIDGTAITLYCGAATALVAAAFALALPHTPPPAKGSKTSVLDVLGLRSLALMKNFSFAVFILSYVLIQIPFSIYFSYGSLFFKDKGFELVTVTMNWGQVAEMVFMLMIPLVIARVGLKWAMTIGLAAMVVRYASFLVGGIYDATWLYFVAILVHGLIFGFYNVGGQIYVDRAAPKETRAQAQAFLFLCYGLGTLIGNFVNERLIGVNTVLGTDGKPVYHWEPVWTAMMVSSVVLLVVFVALFHEKANTRAEAGAAR